MQKKEGFSDQIMFVLPDYMVEKIKINEICSDLYFTDIGHYPRARYHYRERRRASMQNILILCTSGEGWLEIENQRVTLCENQYFIIAAGTPHRYGAKLSNPWTIYWVHFTGNIAGHFVQHFNEVCKLQESPHERHGARISLFKEIFLNLDRGYTMDNLEYSCICLRQLLGSLKYVSQFRRINEPIHPDVATKAITFMKAHIARKIYLKEIAAQCGLSVSHFCLIFKKAIGQPPIDYLNHLRIQMACQLLGFPTLKVKEVAVQVGFEDVLYFSRVFRNVIGQSPSSYRKIRRG